MVLPLLAIVYIAWHVWAILPWPGIWKAFIIALGLLCFLMLFLSIGRKFEALPLSLAQALYQIGTSSIIIMLYLVMVFLVLDLGRLVHLVPKSLLYSNWQSALAIFVLLFGVFLYGNIHYNNKVRVALELKSSKPLPKEYRVVMASDLHLGYHNPRKELARWVEFRRLKTPVYACLGNHEYYSGTPEAQQFYKDAGIHLLSDSHTVIDSAIVIIGRDDRTNMRRKPIKELMTSANGQLYTILLDHQPYQLERSEAAGIDFQLSGHTHRGQVWPISWITDHIYECSWGSHQRGNTQYYVSSGIGIWGGKFRIGTQSEYVVATIRN